MWGRRLGTDTVSLLSIAMPSAAAPAYVALTTSLNTTLTLTPTHHVPTGPSCCATLKRAKDVGVGDQLWAVAAGAPMEAGGVVVDAFGQVEPAHRAFAQLGGDRGARAAHRRAGATGQAPRSR